MTIVLENPLPGAGRRKRPVRRVDAVRAVCCIVLVTGLALALAGCGKKGDPQPPPGISNVYPKIYPHE